MGLLFPRSHHYFMPASTSITVNAAQSGPTKQASRISQLARPPKLLITKPLPDQPVGYSLTKVDTQMTVDSHNMTVDQQYRVRLDLNPSDIELLRYTWNKMLLDEPLNEPKLMLPQLPGSFTMEEEESLGRPHLRQTLLSTVASSLFCRQLYANLLAMKPEIAGMFPSIHHQAVLFAGVISFAISQLERLEAIDQYLCNLGKRHLRILGIEPAMFEILGEALIDTFLERFGLRFTHELEVLWIQLYMYLANLLLQFGMDPQMRLGDNGTQVMQNPVILKPRTVLVASLMDTDSLMEVDSKRGSMMTQSTAPLVVNEATKSVPVMDEPLGMRAKMKKRKRDCVIM